MPKSLVEFIEGVSDGTIPINRDDLVNLINNANQGPQGPAQDKKKARDLQKALLDDFDVDLLLRDCQLMISLLNNSKLKMATTPKPNDPPEATMRY